MKRKIAWIIALPLFIAAVAGCYRRDLELMYRQSIRVVIKCLWEVSAYPEGERPTGMTMYLFRNGEFYNSITTANVDSCEVQLGVGHYNLYMIGQSPEEYSDVMFENMTRYDAASALLKERPADWAIKAPEEVVVRDPESIIVGVADEFDITEDMLEDYQYYYSTWLNKKEEMETAGTKAGIDENTLAYLEDQIQYYSIRIPIYPRNAVAQFDVRIYAGRADVLQSVRASTSGMARSFGLANYITDSPRATQVITYWSLEMDDTERRVGHVDATITTFGLPDGQHPSTLRDSTLNVSALLVDNTTVANYVFDVGDKIEELPPRRGYRTLYRLILGTVDHPAIILPDVDPIETGGGFTANVADWGDEIEADIPI